MASKPATPTIIDLVQASDATCRMLLYGLCRHDQTRAKALKLLADLEGERGLFAEQPRNGVQRGVKRKAEEDLQLCQRCGEPFSEGVNKYKECYFHDGDLEADYESGVWADHDETTHGPIDTEENREDYPEGFDWSCCDKPGDEPGCKVGHHHSLADLSKKGKYSLDTDSVIGADEVDDSDDYDEEEDEDEGVDE